MGLLCGINGLINFPLNAAETRCLSKPKQTRAGNLCVLLVLEVSHRSCVIKARNEYDFLWYTVKGAQKVPDAVFYKMIIEKSNVYWIDFLCNKMQQSYPI